MSRCSFGVWNAESAIGSHLAADGCFARTHPRTASGGAGGNYSRRMVVRLKDGARRGGVDPRGKPRDAFTARIAVLDT